MKKILAFLVQPPIPVLAGLAVLSAVIYYGGAALRSWLGLSNTTLLMIVIGVWVVAVLVFVWRRYQSGKRARLIEDRLRGQAREHKESVRPDKRSQVEELEKQLGTALSTLKTSKLGKNALYELPWYVIIGPPGSGKTTLLRESNLTFPDQAHGRGVRGVGGTRNCDWWFTDQGILLDTAGRYTTQEEDRNEWFSFLDMLKKSRARKPINGAMIAISIADIIQSTEEELSEHARKIRERLAELTQRLEVVFPVYLLFSKCDLLDGFVETFGGYGSRERAQMWGFTMPYMQSSGGSIADQFDNEIDALQSRLAAERLHNLAAAKSKSKKAKIFSFPMQFAMIKARLRSFLAQLDQPNPYHESSDFRGVYFTSGTQEGQPLDQVLANMRNACGLTEEEDSALEEKADKKAYFIDDLFTDVVFPDKELARSSAAAEKRRGLVRRIGMIASAVITLAFLVTLVVNYTQHSSVIDRSMRVYEMVDRKLTADDFAEERRLAKDAGGPFEQLRRMFVELDDNYGSIGSYVMGQNNALYDQRIRPLYVRLLLETFLMPLQDRLRASLQSAVDSKGEDRDVAELQDELMGYEMLGGKLVIAEDWLNEFLLGSRWTWQEDVEIEECRPHRKTFLERVAGPGNRDWMYLPDEGLIRSARELCREKDVLARTVADIRKEQGLDTKVSLEDVIDHTEMEMMDKSVTISKGSTRPTGIDGLLTDVSEQRGDDSAEQLIARNKEDSISEWLETTANFRPAPKKNLREANQQLQRLTTDTEGGVYIKLYTTVCDRLETLGTPCPAGDTSWLTQTLKEIGEICPEVEKLTTRNAGDRIVYDAQHDKQINNVVGALLRARNKVNQRSEEAPAAVRNAIRGALYGLINSVQNSLASELIDETNTTFRAGVGQDLSRFSQRFPFNPEGKDDVDPGKFLEVFDDTDGEFDKTMKWVADLEGVLTQISGGGPTEQHKRDRAKVLDIQRALLAGTKQGCEIEFLMQKLGDTSAVRFVLGKNDGITAVRTKIQSLSWQPADGAAIEIKGFPVPGNDDGVDAMIDRSGNWGFLRLLAHGNPSNTTYKDVAYQKCEWQEFIYDNKQLSAGGENARAALLFRTSAQPNPLEPGFFHHTFTNEVFRGR